MIAALAMILPGKVCCAITTDDQDILIYVKLKRKRKVIDKRGENVAYGSGRDYFSSFL